MTQRTPWGFAKDKTRMYHVWNGMKARCLNPNHEAYENYGGRGIKICDRWLSFKNFYEDMGDPGSTYSLERNDTNGDYEPGNVSWATRREQSLNTRRSVILTYRGETMTAQEWAEKLGIAPKTFRKRLYDGWSVERAIETPLRKSA